MIQLNSVTKKFGKKMVLEDITTEINEGIYGLLGPNGAGKTTLIRCILGIYPQKQGAVLIEGETKKHPNIGYIPQNFELFPQMSIFECMSYFCSMKGIKKKQRKDEIARCLSLVNMQTHQKEKCGKLSGGQIRRVGIAQALLGNPEYIIMDEPTVGLDPEERIRFIDLITEIGKITTIILSTHIIEDVEKCCNQVIILKQGKIVYQNSCDQLKMKADEHTLESGYMNIVKGCE